MARPNSASLRAERIEDNKIVHLRMEELFLLSNGVFSNVYKGRTTEPEEACVVVKKTWSKDGGAKTREVIILDLLKKRKHKNIIQLHYVFSNRHPNNLICYGLVFEYMPMTLSNYLSQFIHQVINIIDVKLFTWQLFRGQAHLNKQKICHRDIKPQNLLVDPETGLLKISDFGSSKIMDEHIQSASYQVTRYYRPPELLLDSNNYGSQIDVWSCGCVFGELLAGEVLLHGRNTDNQLEIIVQHLGLPTAADVEAMHCRNPNIELDDNLRRANQIALENQPSSFENSLPDAPLEGVQLLDRILVYNPTKRLAGVELLSHPFFHQIFSPTVFRTNKTTIQCLTQQDLEQVLRGD